MLEKNETLRLKRECVGEIIIIIPEGNQEQKHPPRNTLFRENVP